MSNYVYPSATPWQAIQSTNDATDRWITWQIAGLNTNSMTLTASAYNPVSSNMTMQWSTDNTTWSTLVFSGNGNNTTTWTISPGTGASVVYVRVYKTGSGTLNLSSLAYSYANLSVTSFALNLTNAGSATSQPIVYIGCQSASATGMSITTGSKVLTIMRAFSAGDIIVVDAKGKTVTVNGTAVPYSGTFPTYTAGANQTVVAVIGGTAVLDIAIVYDKNYL